MKWYYRSLKSFSLSCKITGPKLRHECFETEKKLFNEYVHKQYFKIEKRNW